MDKQEIVKFLKDREYVSVSGKFTGQIILTINLNQGGVTSINRQVTDVIK